ncbi:hypothetical protein XI25_07995 [Paenibacillus sp. DMB20]|nr:hypothetical protein XI25_07995 [Paenibacillus sp. DMB20]
MSPALFVWVALWIIGYEGTAATMGNRLTSLNERQTMLEKALAVLDGFKVRRIQKGKAGAFKA